MFTCTERKDQANQIYNWSLAFNSISPTDRSSLDYGWIIQHQKYQVKWFDGPQSPKSIDVIQPERKYDEGELTAMRVSHFKFYQALCKYDRGKKFL